MGTFIKKKCDINNPEIVSVIDELPFWSAPFCLHLLDIVKYRKNLMFKEENFIHAFKKKGWTKSEIEDALKRFRRAEEKKYPIKLVIKGNIMMSFSAQT